MKPAGQLLARPYFRVSRDTSGHLRSPEEQRGDYERDCADHDWAQGTAYAEKKAVGASRYSKGSRGDFEALLADLRADRFGAGVFWLWESSRGSRKVAEWATLCELCEERGVRVYVHTHGRLYDPGNARDRRSMLEDAVDAEYETAKSSERLKRSVKNRARAGRPHGKLNYGYRRVYDITPGGHKTFLEQVPDEAQAPVVREIFTRVASGEGLQSIATSLRHRDVAPPRNAAVWRTPTMANMIRCRTYLGERVLNGVTEMRGAWPAIVEEGLFGQANAMLSRPERAPRTDPSVRYLLSGIARCGSCGGPLYRSGGGRRSAPAYYCADKHCVSRNAAGLEEYVVPRVIALLARLQLGVDDDDADPALEEAQRELEELRARLEGFADAAAEGRVTSEGAITPATLARIEARLAPKIEAAQRRVQALRVPRMLALSRVNGPIEDVWDDLGIGMQREMIREAVTITVQPVGMGARRFDPSKVTVEPR